MKHVLVVDDLRTMTVDEETAFGLVTYARSSAAAHAILFSWGTNNFSEIWLDHDLGGDDTVRSVVIQLEQVGAKLKSLGFRLPVIRIISSNPVGRQYIQAALEKSFKVILC